MANPKYSAKKLMTAIYRHVGGNVTNEAFLGGRTITGDRGTVVCYYPTNEVFSSAAADGIIKTVYK